MSTTKEQILLIAPELSGLADAYFNIAISDADLLLSSGQFGNISEMACRYLSAHLLTLSKTSGTGNIDPSLMANLSESAGRVSVSRGKAGYDISDATRWDLTKYGMMFWQLCKTRSPLTGAMVV